MQKKTDATGAPRLTRDWDDPDEVRAYHREYYRKRRSKKYKYLCNDATWRPTHGSKYFYCSLYQVAALSKKLREFKPCKVPKSNCFWCKFNVRFFRGAPEEQAHDPSELLK